MVETLERSGERERILARRVQSLLNELDQLEDSNRQLSTLLASSVKTLCGLEPADGDSAVGRAVRDLREAATRQPLDPLHLARQLGVLQSALLSFEPPAPEPEPEPEPLQEVERVYPSPEAGSADPASDLEHQRAIFEAIDALACLAPADPVDELYGAVDELRQLVRSIPFDPERVEEAAERVRQVLILHRDAPVHEALAAVPEETSPIQAETRDLAGWSLALNLLKGMRLDAEPFNSELNSAMEAIQDYLASGESDRPALGMASDLMERFRARLAERHQEAHRGLLQVVGELMRSHNALVRLVDEVGNRLLDGGRETAEELRRGLADLGSRAGEAGVARLADRVSHRLSWQSQVLHEALQRSGELRKSVQGARMRMQLSRQDQERRWSQAALSDALTGAWNQKALQLMLRGRMAESSGQFCLILCRVDSFDSLVDSWGGQAADNALVSIAGYMGDCLRENDFLFRCGPDAFAALLEGASLGAASKAATRIRDRVESIKFTYLGNRSLHLSATLLVARPGKEESPQDFWGRAWARLQELGQNAEPGGVHRLD